MFIVLEGIDGAGKGRQRHELLAHFDEHDVTYDTTDFPDHEGALYRELIHPALHSEIDVPSEAMFLSFALDQLLWKPRIEMHTGKTDTHFIADGYYTTNIAYQSMLLGSIALDTALDFAETFKLPRPELVVFLDVDPDKAVKRKLDEEGHEEGFDMFEADIEKQRKIRSAFLKLADNNTFGTWAVIDGNGPVDQVFSSILAVLKEHGITY
ncbi:MAG: Thymidylate kinase [candidate division WS6 bacterium OLB20]|uniref:Thymidylate kinase n=1 Tax=candidate division WS6 bacterium OLB20 TaxID=1617426 RepID=A0A136LYG0_9BACT|nr:MAG: Thymidylate kinase [candidate division WS6 bacterium OLB20]